MQTFENAGGGAVVLDLTTRIVESKAYLSEIDGKTGDGDHGVNMAKGFGMAAERLSDGETSLSDALATLGDVLLTEIGGSMGPLYGAMFGAFAEVSTGAQRIDASLFSKMLHAGLEEITAVGSAKPGDKTLLDTLVPAIAAFDGAVAEGKSFDEALAACAAAAERGRDSTLDMVARTGRAARLGERSRGFLDAGATSCAIILTSIANGVRTRLAA